MANWEYWRSLLLKAKKLWEKEHPKPSRYHWDGHRIVCLKPDGTHDYRSNHLSTRGELDAYLRS